MKNRPVLFATTPTSGTASMERVLRVIASGYQILRVNSKAQDSQGADGTFIDPSAERVIYWFQGGDFWNNSIDLDPFDVIAHLRDPRDLACNQYWWALQHPNRNDPPEVAEKKRDIVKAGGIDKYALNRNNIASFSMIRSISEGTAGNRAVYTSYAQLCCAFDIIIFNLCALFGRLPNDVRDILTTERPENLGGNRNWVKVGGTWEGSDLSPGRFRRELSESTCHDITEKYRSELAMCRKRDASFLSHHYE